MGLFGEMNEGAIDGDQNDNVLDENTETEAMKESDVPMFNIDTDKPGKEVPREVPIEYFLSPVNRRVHVATPELMARKDLIPCTQEGKKVYDHRIF